MIMLQLREQTRAYHDRLERNVDILERCRSLEEYRLLLAKFYGFYVPIESGLRSRSDWDQFGSGFEPRSKAPLLHDDLRTLGMTETDLGRLPHCRSLPALDSLAQALGCLYVLEGATLGGQIIARHLKTMHSLDANSGCAFFCSYGSAVGAMWKSFGRLLTAYSEPRNIEEIIVGSACDTFAALDRWLVEES